MIGKMRGNEGVQLVEGAGASPQIAVLEVVEVDPGVGGVLLAADHCGRLVVRARVLDLRIVVHYTRP